MSTFVIAAVSVCLVAGAAVADPVPTPTPVVVDPRIELMSVVQMLAEYPLVTQYDFLYKKDAAAYFEPFREHPAVALFAAMADSGFAFDAVPKAMLALTDPPELAVRAPYPEGVIERAGGEAKLAAFTEAMRDFARESRFDAFFDAHRGTFRDIVDSTQATVDEAVRVLRDYSGMDVKGGTVILGMMMHHGGFAALIEGGDGKEGEVEAYAMVGPVGGKDGAPTFGTAERIVGTAWHELSHTFINPLTAAHAEEVAALSSLQEPVAEAMRRNAYADWPTIVNEHVIRAITTRLAYRQQGEEAGDAERKRQLDKGFAYLDPLLARLEEYEGSRDRYPSLAEFYPRLLDALAGAEASPDARTAGG